LAAAVADSDSTTRKFMVLLDGRPEMVEKSFY
jgi:hypothetical protein